MIQQFHFWVEFQKNLNQDLLEKMWRNWNPPTLLVGMQIGEAIMENSMEFLQKIKNRITI